MILLKKGKRQQYWCSKHGLLTSRKCKKCSESTTPAPDLTRLHEELVKIAKLKTAFPGSIVHPIYTEAMRGEFTIFDQAYQSDPTLKLMCYRVK